MAPAGTGTAYYGVAGRIATPGGPYGRQLPRASAPTGDLVYRTPPSQGGLSIETIDRFIGRGNPLAAAGGARLLVQATDGNLLGAAFLAALARKESEFGRTAGRFRNNFWGWGVHLGPSVNTSPSVLEGARKVWRGLSSGGLYREQGIVTPSAIIRKYAPPSENDTGLYQRQVGEWFRSMGLDPNANIFNGQRVPVPEGGGQPGRQFTRHPDLGGGGGQPAALQRFTITPALQRQIDAYLIGSRQDVLAGRTPRDALGVVQAISREQERQRVASAQFDAPPPDTMSLRYGASARAEQDHGDHTHYDASRYPAGGPDSGRVHRGGDGGNWGGSLERALHVAEISGLPVTSQKRSRQRTASGGVSDHWVGSTRSYAVDLGTSGSAGDQAYVRILRGLGLDPGRYRSGTWHNINIGGYRYQIGWRTPGHFDHIHVGVQRVG